MEFGGFFIDSQWKSFIRHLLCKYFLTPCGWLCLLREDISNFDGVQLKIDCTCVVSKNLCLTHPFFRWFALRSTLHLEVNFLCGVRYGQIFINFTYGFPIIFQHHLLIRLSSILTQYLY